MSSTINLYIIPLFSFPPTVTLLVSSFLVISIYSQVKLATPWLLAPYTSLHLATYAHWHTLCLFLLPVNHSWFSVSGIYSLSILSPTSLIPGFQEPFDPTGTHSLLFLPVSHCTTPLDVPSFITQLKFHIHH